MVGAGSFSLRRSTLESYRVEGDDVPVAIPDMGSRRRQHGRAL
jgi:hypothetical protein